MLQKCMFYKIANRLLEKMRAQRSSAATISEFGAMKRGNISYLLLSTTYGETLKSAAGVRTEMIYYQKNEMFYKS